MKTSNRRRKNLKPHAEDEARCGIAAPDFLLSAMAMLTAMEETSLQRLLTTDSDAVKLLEFISQLAGRRANLDTILDVSPLPLAATFSVIYAVFLSEEHPLRIEEWSLQHGLDPAAILSLVGSLRTWLASQGLSDKVSLRRTLAEENLRIGELEIAGDLMRQADLMTARDELEMALAEGKRHPELPSNKTNEEVLAEIMTELDEINRYVIGLEQGRLARGLATAEA